MENKISILCFICLIISSDANMKVFRKHDGMDMGSPPPPSSATPISGNNSDHHMSNANTDDMHMSMKLTHMTFFWGKNSEILFSGWPGTRTGMYVLALIVVFVMGVIVEWLSNIGLMTEAGPRSFGVGMIQTAVHGIRVGIAYLVMLALMSFNVGVFIVAVLGHIVGYLVFGSRVFKNTKDSLPPRVCC